jgi:hypothetical protein
MAKRFSVLGASVTTNAAAVATAMGGGTTTAEAQALGELISLFGKAVGNQAYIGSLGSLMSTSLGKELLPG